VASEVDAGAPATPDADAAVEEAPLPPVPPAPPKRALTGDAAIVWVSDEKAQRGFRSVLIERVAGQAKVVRQRKEPVLVGVKDLWVIRQKKTASKACAECELCTTDPPTCHRNDAVDIDEPYLLSLRNRQKLEPWSGAYGPRDGCAQGVGDHGLDFVLLGGVGRTYFVTVHTWDYFCGAAHPMFEDVTLSFDIDTGKEVPLSFPNAPKATLLRDARTELVAGCVMDEKDEVSEYRARAEYSSSGELRGVYELTMPAPYMCGNGPGHYSTLSEQTSDWIPPELEDYGKLPGWVTAYMAGVDAKYAFMIDSKRAPAVRREIAR